MLIENTIKGQLIRSYLHRNLSVLWFYFPDNLVNEITVFVVLFETDNCIESNKEMLLVKTKLFFYSVQSETF